MISSIWRNSLLSLAFSLSAVSGHAQQGPAGVATDFVELRAVSETVPVFAQVVPTRESEVAVRVSGVVTDVPVVVGQQVANGDVLAVLDRELLTIELQRAESAMAEAVAGIQVAEAGLTLADRGFRRVEGLRDTNAFSQGQYEDREGALARAIGEMARAEAQLLNAEVALSRAAYDLERAEVRTPFAGTIMEVHVDPGEYLQTGAAVARVLDTSDIEVEANVPALYVSTLFPGLGVTGQNDAGSELDLNVRAILPTEFSATRTRPVRFEADLAGGATPVAIGQSVTVNIPVTEARDVLLVPKDAVVQSRGAWNVFLHQEGQAVPRTIEIGGSYGETFEVLSGLQHGDEVVVRGNERLRPMQPIAPRPIRPAPDQSAASN